MEPCVQMRRSESTVDLFRYPYAFTLLAMISYRAQRTQISKIKGLKIGEALIGDHRSCGMTRGQYREALEKLIFWNFVTTRTTNRGTIVKLINTDVFNPNFDDSNQQSNQPTTITATTQQPPSNHPTTTIKNKRMKEEKIKDLCSPEGGEPERDTLEDLPEPKKKPGYETKKHEFLTGKILEAYTAFWTAWNGTCSWAVAKNDAADVFREIFLKTPREERKPLFDRILSGASCEARARQLKKDNGSTPVNPARWLREERWEQYDYQPPKGYEPTAEAAKPEPENDPQEQAYQEYLRLEAERATAHA